MGFDVLKDKLCLTTSIIKGRIRRNQDEGSGAVLQLGRVQLVLLVATPSRNRIGDVSSISSHTVDLF